MERSPAMLLITQVPTIIVGMDVSHSSPGQSVIPSVAAVIHIMATFIKIEGMCACVHNHGKAKIPSPQKLKTNSIGIRRGELQSCNNSVTI
ncbi:LOW QUALITY PROTEIN: hypothetical protein YC2023_016953 [Brassica napus]